MNNEENNQCVRFECFTHFIFWRNTYGKKLVAYFSAGGTTRKIAEMIAQATKADLYEIMPKQPYTSDDLNWMDKKSRSSVEMSDKKYRPEIADTDAQIDGYDTIFLGFPIWGTAPRIIQTFIESYDISVATVYMFCTSGGSGIEKSISDLRQLYPDINIAGGKRLNNATESDIRLYLKQ